MNFVIPDLIRLSEDEPYGVKGANIILKFSKLQDKHDGHQSPSKFSKLRRSSNISSCSTSSEHDGFEGAVTIGDFKICNDTVSNKLYMLSWNLIPYYDKAPPDIKGYIMFILRFRHSNWF